MIVYNALFQIDVYSAIILLIFMKNHYFRL